MLRKTSWRLRCLLMAGAVLLAACSILPAPEQSAPRTPPLGTGPAAAIAAQLAAPGAAAKGEGLAAPIRARALQGQASTAPLPAIALSDDVTNYLLIGLDSTRNLRGQNTDVLIIVSVNKATRQVSLLSLPRDLWVYIPTMGWSRINVAHRQGYVTGYPGEGPGLLIRTIEVNFGIPIEHWGRIDFQGFTRVVDQLGGVEMTVPCPVNLRYVAPDPDAGEEGQEELILEPGVYQMDGATALKYVRTRRGTSDFDRARRQQQFLKAMWQQLRSTDIIPKIPGLWSALNKSIETDLGLGDILSLAPLALDLKPQRIRSRYIGSTQTVGWTNADGWQVLVPDYGKVRQVVASLFAPPSGEEDQVAEEAARIRVRNGTYRPQLALIGADEFRWHGLTVVDTGLADRPDYAQTQVVVFQDRPRAVQLLTQLLKVKPENIVYRPDPDQVADIEVILGNDYDPCR